MIYRENGQFKISYSKDQALLTISQDKFFIFALVAFSLLIVPLIASDYWLTAILIPFLVFTLAALGLNILTGYAGQLSLGTAAFMAVGAYAAYNFQIRVPNIPIIFSFIGGGLIAAAVGVLFGLPSLRIRGFYLAVATLAAQFFIPWLLIKVEWFSNYNPSGVITTPPVTFFGFIIDTPVSKYIFILVIVILLTILAKNLIRSKIGRSWMAVRDMDIAAEVIGIPIMKTKLIAFAVSSFYCGVAGAVYAFLYLGSVEPDGFNIDLSFRILFMIIIGGIGSVMGSYFGAAFITLLPILLENIIHFLAVALSITISSAVTSVLQLLIFGALIIFFLIVEPHGLARLWSILKEKLRLWPFPY